MTELERLRFRVDSLVRRVLCSMEADHIDISGKKVSWSYYKARAKRTGQLDFDCQFKDGHCKRSRNDASPEAKMGCCQGCPSTIGYLKEIERGSAWSYAQLFDPLTGFWREGKGCILPREMRSPICLSYNCHEENYGKLRVWGFLKTGKTEFIQIALVKK